MKMALFFEKLKDNKVACRLCNHFCMISDGHVGFCGVRKNIGGQLFTLTYGNLVAAHVDPIEKKPFYHFMPGSISFSIATAGCNFRCDFCQNYEISQRNAEQISDRRETSPEQVVHQAIAARCASISYTYTEPTIFMEYALDCAKLAKEKGLYNNFVTNGFMSQEALDAVAPYLDAANVDVKGNHQFYKQVCRGKLDPVLENIRTMKERGIWVEVTTLLIPDRNDDRQTFLLLAEKLLAISPDIPWHFSRFFPTYRMQDHYATPQDTIWRAREEALKMGFRYVYTGNMPGNEGENTACPGCRNVIIRRQGFSVYDIKMKGNRCGFCGFEIAGVFSASHS